MDFLNKVITINWIANDFLLTGNHIFKIHTEKESSLKFRDLLLD